MTEWDRLFFLPIAGVYLAEACWRLDDEAASDDAADLALAAARRQGSNHLLLQALREFPAAVSAASTPNGEPTRSGTGSAER